VLIVAKKFGRAEGFEKHRVRFMDVERHGLMWRRRPGVEDLSLLEKKVPGGHAKSIPFIGGGRAFLKAAFSFDHPRPRVLESMIENPTPHAYFFCCMPEVSDVVQTPSTMATGDGRDA